MHLTLQNWFAYLSPKELKQLAVKHFIISFLTP